MICKKHTVKVNGKKQLPKNTVIFDSAEQIKKAAEKRNNEQMLIEIRDWDLIAKEFRKHEKRYRDYTRTIWGTSI